MLKFSGSRTDLLETFPKGGRVAEIGVQMGKFSKKIFDIVQPDELVLIDCWEEQSQEIYPENSNNPQRIQDKYYRRVKRKFRSCTNVKILKMYSDVAAKSFSDGYFDWVYIDGNHQYDAVLLDLYTWKEKVNADGFLFGHDYCNPIHPGVRKAVDEFIEANSKEWKIDIVTTDDPPSYVLERI